MLTDGFDPFLAEEAHAVHDAFAGFDSFFGFDGDVAVGVVGEEGVEG